MFRRALRALWFLSCLGLLVGCANETAPRCLPGDQVQCRCAGAPDGGAAYGYRTCRAGADGGVEYGACDCVLGLLPNLGSPLSTPYMSGMGSGNALDAGTH